MESDSKNKKRIQWAGLFLGPLMAAVCLWTLPTEYTTGAAQDAATADSQVEETASTPQDTESNAEDNGKLQEFSWAGRATLAVMVWMGIWWLSEAIDISLTALLPMVAFPWLGAASMDAATAPYANKLIFLYFGGFVLALSMERWGLGKRIALLTLKFVGTTAPRMIAGFMLVTAILSAFVSNTATTAMMLPIALSVIALIGKAENGDRQAISSFGTCLLLAIAYSASVGGIMTIIGTPTNAFLIGFLENSIAEPYQYSFDFQSWLPIGASVAIVFLPLIYFALTRFLFPIRGVELQGGAEMITRELKSLGFVRRGEWNTLVVFIATVMLWLVRPLLQKFTFSWGDATLQPFAAITDTGIVMTSAMCLFLLPVDVGKRVFTMDWETTKKVPWGILLLFGGGLSLAKAVQANGVAEFLGSYAGRFGSLPEVAMILLVTAAIVFLTELTSNVATTTSLVPVLAAIAPGVGIHPYVLILPATIAASCAFMLPVATPPNAIVFGSGAIELRHMLRAGIWLNLLAIIVVTSLTVLVIRPYMGI